MSLQRTQSEVEDVEMDFEAVDTSVMDEPLLAAIHGNDVATVAAAGVAETAKPTTAKTYALHEACEHGAFDAVKFLVGELAHDVDARDEQHWTPLHYAAAFGGAPELVHYLLAAGADPSAEDEDGATPLETYLDENESDDPTALLLRSVAEHVEAAEGRDYETWAQVHARDATYGAYVAASRPKYVRDATRHAYLLLRANAMRQHDDASLGASPEAFLLGAHGGHAVVDTVLSFLA